MNFTKDFFLGERVQVIQPLSGYRAATDPVLLAAACPAQSGMQTLDVGSGAGTASLCLATRVEGLKMSGIEVQKQYADLSCENANLNDKDWQVFNASIYDAPQELKNQSFDLVLSNPPFFTEGTSSPNSAKDTANQFDKADLKIWIDFCLKRLKSGGYFTIINRTERLADMISVLGDRVGAIEIIPLWPRKNTAAKRVIIRCKKDSKSPLQISAGLTLHRDDNNYTAEAEAILRHGSALD